MKVIIAEKPSVAANIATALNIKNRKDGYYEGVDYYITWAFGHLLELYDAKDYDKKMEKWDLKNFPFIPDEFKYKIKTDSKNRNKTDAGARKQLGIIKKLINDKEVKGVISATDWDREGEVIAKLILDHIDTKKPIERLLLNEWTEEEVLRGLKDLKPISFTKTISDAGVCRQQADWSIGINLTTASTLQFGRNVDGVVNIGRVLLPTLKIVYDRDLEIENFKPENFYRLEGSFITDKKEKYTGSYHEKGNKFPNKKHLTDIQKLAKDKKAQIVHHEKKGRLQYAPSLFNLTGLQGEVTSKYTGFTSDKVLAVAQKLYENKFITYPRTASTALEESLIKKTERVLDSVKKGLPYEKEIKFTKSKRVFDNKKVDGHSAIIPTYIRPGKLTKDEQIIYDEIRDRFVMQFMPVSKYDETVIQTKIQDKSIEGAFISKGRVVTQEGWKKVQKVNTKELTLPQLKKSDVVDVDKLSATTHKTTPPPYHMEKSILRIMETCGRNVEEENILDGFSIGTPATRASTIKKLRTAGYIKPRGKTLTCTKLGRQLVEMFPIKSLFDLDYTGKLEKSLSSVEKGTLSKDEFLEYIYSFTNKSVNTIKKQGGVNLGEERESLGTCPDCGNTIEETEKNFGCNGWKEGCKYTIWKNDRFLGSMKKKPTKEMVIALLTDGEVLVKGLESKKGNVFDAILSYKYNEESGYYNWDMRFPDNN